MSVKYFIDDGVKKFSVFAKPKPTNPNYVKVVVIPDALLGEDDRWLQIEAIDVDGSLVDTVTVDEPLKLIIQQQDLDDQIAEQAAKDAEKALRDSYKDKADKTKNRKIDSLVEIKNEILNIYDILDALVNKEI